MRRIREKVQQHPASGIGCELPPFHFTDQTAENVKNVCALLHAWYLQQLHLQQPNFNPTEAQAIGDLWDQLQMHIDALAAARQRDTRMKDMGKLLKDLRSMRNDRQKTWADICQSADNINNAYNDELDAAFAPQTIIIN